MGWNISYTDKARTITPNTNPIKTATKIHVKLLAPSFSMPSDILSTEKGKDFLSCLKLWKTVEFLYCVVIYDIFEYYFTHKLKSTHVRC